MTREPPEDGPYFDCRLVAKRIFEQPEYRIARLVGDAE